MGRKPKCTVEEKAARRQLNAKMDPMAIRAGKRPHAQKPLTLGNAGV